MEIEFWFFREKKKKRYLLCAAGIRTQVTFVTVERTTHSTTEVSARGGSIGQVMKGNETFHLFFKTKPEFSFLRYSIPGGLIQF